MTAPTYKTALVLGATGLIGDLLTHRLVDSHWNKTGEHMNRFWNFYAFINE